MGVPSEPFEEFLVPDESIVADSPGSLYDHPYRSAGSIGVTDRRVLFVSEEGDFVDVAHDAINSIRSRPRSTIAYPSAGPLLVALVGTIVATSAFAGVLALEPSALAMLLGLVTVGGVAIAEHVRRHGTPGGRLLSRRTSRRIYGAVDRIGLRDRLDQSGVDLPDGALVDGGADGDDDLVVVGVVSLALVASIGLIALAESLLVVPLSLVALAGIATVEYGYRRLQELDGVGMSRRREREVSLHLVDGGVVHLWVDPDGHFDRDLSAVARGSVQPSETVEPPRP